MLLLLLSFVVCCCLLLRVVVCCCLIMPSRVAVCAGCLCSLWSVGGCFHLLAFVVVCGRLQSLVRRCLLFVDVRVCCSCSCLFGVVSWCLTCFLSFVVFGVRCCAPSVVAILWFVVVHIC